MQIPKRESWQIFGASGSRMLKRAVKLGRCSYCGQPVPLMRAAHPECQQRHSIAVETIPTFFSKFLGSDLSPTRFCELLRNAADFSYLTPAELADLIRASVKQMFEGILATRLLTDAELVRARELADAAEAMIGTNLDVDALFAKIAILNACQNNVIANLVTVTSQLPFDLQKSETVVWIFNNVVSVGKSKSLRKTKLFDLDLTAKPQYYGYSQFKEASPPKRRLGRRKGDLLLTSRNLYIIDNDAESSRWPLSKVLTVSIYPNGIGIECDPKDQRDRVFAVDDVWFAANLLAGLLSLTRQASAPIKATEPTEPIESPIAEAPATETPPVEAP